MPEIETLSLLFDSAWYLATYQDVAAANCDPLEHYLAFGYKEGRNPNRFFNTSFYLNTYTDLAASHLNPFIHYILYGASEGRLPRSPHELPLPPITFDIFLQEDDQEENTDISVKTVPEPIEKKQPVAKKVIEEEAIKKQAKPPAPKSKKNIRKPTPQTKTSALTQKRKIAQKT